MKARSLKSLRNRCQQVTRDSGCTCQPAARGRAHAISRVGAGRFISHVQVLSRLSAPH